MKGWTTVDELAGFLLAERLEHPPLDWWNIPALYQVVRAFPSMLLGSSTRECMSKGIHRNGHSQKERFFSDHGTPRDGATGVDLQAGRKRRCSIVGSHKMATNSTQLQAEVNQSMILFVRALFKRRSSILLALSIYPIYVGYSTLSRICTFFLAWFLLDGNNFIFFHLISRYTCVWMYHCSILSYLGSF